MTGWLTSRRRRWAVALLVAAVALAAFGVAQRLADLGEAPRYGERPLAVDTVSAERATLELTRDYLALVEATRTAAVSARFTAAVTEVVVDEGEQVTEGAVLARLDASEVRAERRAAAAEIRSLRAERQAERANREALAESAAYWQRELERRQRLAEQDMASESEVESTADRLTEVRGRLAASKGKVASLGEQLEAAAARHDQLSARLADYTLRAPFAGTVTARHVDNGDQAAPGKPLVELAAASRRLAFDVPQEDLERLRPGLTLRYTRGGQRHTTPLDRLHPRLDSARLARAEADLPEGAAPGLRPGAYRPVTAVLRTVADRPVVPAAAVTESPGGAPHVFTVADDRLRAHEVDVAARSGDRVAVRGIPAGAEVVVSTYLGWSRLADGRRVTAKP